MTYVRAWHVSLLRHEVDCGSDGEVTTLIEKPSHQMQGMLRF